MMSIHRIHWPALLLIPVLSLIASADDAPTTAPAVHQSLEKDMGAMGRAMKKLKGQVSDKAQNSSSVATVVALEQATLDAKSQLPPMIAKLPDDQKAKQAAEYQSMMANLLQQELELEQNLLANDNDKAAKTYDAITEIEQQGHKEFRPKRNGGAPPASAPAAP